MKHLLILLCVTTLVSCGIKDTLLNSTGGTIGIPKQPTQNTATDCCKSGCSETTIQYLG